MGRSTRPGTLPPARHFGAASVLGVHVLVSTPARPHHCKELVEDRIALPFGEAKFVSQVLRIGNAENIDRDTPLQLA
jgi:hypothetical protein